MLYEHEAARELGVIGVPVDGSDQRVKAFVMDEPGSEVTAEALIEFCAERLARFEAPEYVEFRDELPKTFVGKILRPELAVQERRRQRITETRRE